MRTRKKYGENRECGLCRSLFWVYPYRFSVAKYCSKRCANTVLGSLPSTRLRISQRNKERGIKPPPRWNGGVSTENELARKSVKMKEWRRKVFERDDYTCQGCGIRGGVLHADHELPFCTYKDLRYEVLNGRTFCEECHRKYGWTRERNWWQQIELALKQDLYGRQQKGEISIE